MYGFSPAMAFKFHQMSRLACCHAGPKKIGDFKQITLLADLKVHVDSTGG